MSRIGKKLITIPAGVEVSVSDSQIKVKGPKGELTQDRLAGIEVKVDSDAKTIEAVNSDFANRQLRANHGTMRALINNMVEGVSKGFEKKMMIYGTGYSIKEQGKKIVLAVGFCHTVELEVPTSVKVDIKVPATRGNDVPAEFAVSGYDKAVLGQFAAEIRGVRPPEPYKGKGIRYADENVIRKAGKAFGS